MCYGEVLYNITFWAKVLKRKLTHTEKEKKISDPGRIRTHNLHEKITDYSTNWA